MMDMRDQLRETLRVAVGRAVTEDELTSVIHVLPKLVELTTTLNRAMIDVFRRQLEGKVILSRQQVDVVRLAAGMLRHLRGHKYKVRGKQRFVTKMDVIDALDNIFGRLTAPVEEFEEFEEFENQQQFFPQT